MTLVITEGANWNDGMPLTMDDWLFTLQYNKDHADKGISWSGFLKDVEWRAEGSSIIFTLPETNWRFHYNFTGIGTFSPIPKHVWEGQDPTTFKNPDAVHSGPYTLVSSNPDTRTTIWERRDDYWDPDRLAGAEVSWSGSSGPKPMWRYSNGKRATSIWGGCRSAL